MTSCSHWYNACHWSHYLKALSLRGASVFNYILLWDLIRRHHPLSELALLRKSRLLFSRLCPVVLNIRPLSSVFLNRASCRTKTLCSCFKFFSCKLTDWTHFPVLPGLRWPQQGSEKMIGFWSVHSSRWVVFFITNGGETISFHIADKKLT